MAALYLPILIALFVASPYAMAGEGALTQSVSIAAPAPAAPKEKAPKDWKKETEATCGMNCRYSRASENYSLQAVYLLKKIQLIDSAIKDGSKEEAARTALGGFCKSSTEEIATCFRRYKDFQAIALLEIRESIGKIDDYKRALIHGIKPDGSVEGTALVYDVGVEKNAYIPEVPTLAELEKAYLDGKLRSGKSKYTANDIRKWSQDLIVNDPKARYIEYNKKPTDGNPYQSEKTSYRLYTGDTSSGKTKSDSKALKIYDRSKQSVMEFAADKSLDPKGVKPISPNETKKEDSISYEAMKDTRNTFNSKIEGGLKEDAVKRAPAAKKDPKALTADTSEKSAGSKDVLVRDVANQKSKFDERDRNDDYKVTAPEGMKDSRYIKYNPHQLLDDIEKSTK